MLEITSDPDPGLSEPPRPIEQDDNATEADVESGTDGENVWGELNQDTPRDNENRSSSSGPQRQQPVTTVSEARPCLRSNDSS